MPDPISCEGLVRNPLPPTPPHEHLSQGVWTWLIWRMNRFSIRCEIDPTLGVSSQWAVRGETAGVEIKWKVHLWRNEPCFSLPPHPPPPSFHLYKKNAHNTNNTLHHIQWDMLLLLLRVDSFNQYLLIKNELVFRWDIWSYKHTIGLLEWDQWIQHLKTKDSF